MQATVCDLEQLLVLFDATRTNFQFVEILIPEPWKLSSKLRPLLTKTENPS